MGQRCWGDLVGLPVSGVGGRGCRVLCVLYVSFNEVCIIMGFVLCERRPREVGKSWGLRRAGKAAWAWVWGSRICIGCALFAGFCISR